MSTEEQLTAEEQAAMDDMSKVEDMSPDDVEATGGEPAEASAEVAPEGQKGEAEAGDDKAEPKAARKDAPPEGFVPHQAMHAERVKRQQLEQQLSELAAWKKAIEEQQAVANEPQYVDPLLDPVGHRKWNEHQIAQTRQMVEAQQQAQQQQAQMVHRATSAQNAEAEFAAKTPDYQDAFNYMVQSRQQELASMGYGPAEIQQQLSADANSIYDAASNLGMNPAQLLYLRAQSSGYTKAAPAPASPDPAVEAQKIEATAAAQRATQGLGSQGGQASGKITAAQLAGMSEAELAKVDPDAIREAMGG